MLEGTTAPPTGVPITLPIGCHTSTPSRSVVARRNARATLTEMRSRGLLLATALVAVVLGACGDDGAPQADAERFCGEAIAHTSAIVAPPLDDEAGVEATLDFYRLMGELAPLSIAEEWNRLVVALEIASELEPGNADSEQMVAATAYATEPAAHAVAEWLARNCGLDIPITTIAPHDQVAPAVPPVTSVPTTPAP